LQMQLVPSRRLELAERLPNPIGKLFRPCSPRATDLSPGAANDSLRVRVFHYAR
jgi:hypothetical protein